MSYYYKKPRDGDGYAVRVTLSSSGSSSYEYYQVVRREDDSTVTVRVLGELEAVELCERLNMVWRSINWPRPILPAPERPK